MKSEQNSDILSVLSVESELTAYAISKETGISVPQVNFRIDKLVKCGVVIPKEDGVRTVYSAHPVLRSRDAIELIATYIKEIVDAIDGVQSIQPTGAKAIIEFILDKTEINEPVDTEADETLVRNFRSELEAYATKYNLKITDIKGWTEDKIIWMALNEKKCACAPDKRVCPCPEGLVEIDKKGKCKCSVFMK